MSGTGLGWPALVPPYRNRLEEWFSTPEKLHASFDTREELVSLLRACDNTLLESSLQLIADALLEWHADNARTVASGRRESRRRLTECLPSVPGTGLSLHEHYNQIALQSPLALLPVLRKRKLATDRVVDRGARATEEIRLRQEYALRLAAIMQEAQLPVCKVLAGVSNAEEAWPRLFGTRRSKTLRNRFRAWDKFREWLLYSRGRSYPEGVADVLDYANERFQEGCGKTVLESLQASLSVIEGVGRVPSTQQISQDPTWQAQLKSYTADLVSAAPPEQPASMLTVAIVLACEIFVCTPGEPSYLRALGFVCLLMVWGSLRADDVQGLLPQTMLLDERGLSIDLARSKTTGPDKRTHTVKVFVERSISLTGHDWLKVGYALWKDFDFERDYLVLKANEGFTEPLEKSVPSSTVALYFRKVLSELKTPKREGRTWKANDQRPLLPGYTSSHFTGHSARNFLSSVGAAIDVDPRELDYLGRWKVGGEGSATYIRTSRQVVHRLQSHIACSLVTGQPKHYIEVDSIKALTDYAAKAGESESQVRRRHTLLEGSKGLGGSWPTLALEVGVAAPPSPVEQVSMPGSRGDYFIVTSRTTGLRRLHMLGCYVKPENCYDVKFVSHVGAEDVDNICKDCKARMKAQAGEEESDPSSSDSGSESMRFQAIADSRPEARAAGKADFGLDDGAADGRQQIAGVVAAWELARDVISKETETRAEAKVLGQPRILQVTERQAMLKAVAAVHGQLGESETPSSEYLALKCEECEANEPQASTLDAITSKKNTLTTSIQSSLDASGRIHITQHKSKSELPTTTEAYRKVLRVEAFTWLCMASRFKSKQWLQDLKLSDFDHFVNYILGEKVAQLSVPTSHQPADETYFTTPLALSIIERPRKWHKGKGKGDVGSYLQSLGNVTNLLQFDLQRSTEHDLTKEGLWQHIFQLLGEGDWILIVEQANYFLDQTVTACQLAWQYVLEHPEDLGATPDHELPASIWQLPALRELQVSTQAITFAFFQCSFEAPTSKPTRLLTNLRAFVEQPPPFASWPRFDSSDRYVGPLPPRCPHGKHDKVLAGREGSRWATESSAAYPPLLCEWLAHAVLASASQGGLGSAPHSSVPGEAGPMQESHEATQEVHQDLCEVPQGLHQVVSDRVEAVTDRVEAVGLIESEAPPSTLLPSPDSSGHAMRLSRFFAGMVSSFRAKSTVLILRRSSQMIRRCWRGGEVERPEPFKHQECHNIGLPLNLEWDGKTQPITDGFGLCSPTRWPPEARGGLLPKQALEFATAMHQVLRDFVADVVPDIKRTAMELALGKCTDLDVVPSGQPFFLHAEDSYVSGVAIGYDCPVAAARSVKREGVAFRTDAKCADGYVVLGGWDCAGTTQESRWFSLRLTPSEAPYLFDSEGHSQWASASAELLATLAALHIFGHLEAGPTRRLMKVEVLAQTDNKSNEGLTRKGSTTRWPLLMVNMQLTHVLMKAGLRLNLGWRPRDENQEADDLTNEIFDRFSEELRVPVQYSELPLSFLHTLYEARRAQLSSREVDSIRDTVQEGDRLVKTVHAAISQLESQGHVYTMQLQPTMVGISSQNRDGSGINPVDVHDLLGDIVQAGWLDARVQAIAHEPTGQEDIDWNVRLFQSMHDRCGPLEPTMIKALSLAGSHTNSVLRCFHYEVMHEGDETVCHDGRLSMELLRKHDPDFARAVREGVVWKILSKHVAAQLPQLLGLVQRMGNATLHRGEHELQLMRRLHQTWVQMSSQGSVDVLALKSKVTTGKSVHGKSMPHLYSFVLKTAGGTDPFLLSTRSLGPGFWEKVSADVKGSNQFPRFRHAMVKLAYCKEAVGSAECKKMLHKDSTASVKEADTIMSTWRKLVTALPDGAELLMKPEVQTCLSYGDMSLAAFTLNVMLPGEDLKKYKTSQSLAHDLVLILEGILKTDLNGPWAAHKVADSGEASGSKQVGAPMAIMRELSSDGSVKDSAVMMAESGFSVGQYVRRKADQETGQVTAIELGRVKLKQPSGSVVRVSIDSFLAGHWQVYTPKPEPQTVDDLSVYSPLNFPEYERQMLLACLYMDMHELMQKHDTNPMLQKLRVTLKPRKSVQATAFIPKNKLIMVPMGLTIKHGQKKPEDAIFDIITPMSDYFFWIVSFIQIPKAEGDAGFINPAFLVQPLPVSDTWNCEVSHVKSNRDKKVQLPILKNTLDLQQDDVLYMPKAEKTVHVEALQVDTPPRKRICSKKPGDS
ncbi:unnamed protein product [Symbiodinium sp. CCMP2592]|nr:unnamed protein product [Symbiodinium sp. CCMP2592]